MQKWEKINKEMLEEIISSSKTKAEALQKMGYIGTGHTKIINKISEKYGIDISHLEKESIIKRKFGMLEVIQPTTQRDNQRNIKYCCLCDCGNYTYAIRSDLIKGKVVSCGCLHSKGEALINKLLTEMNINFQTQYTFPDLKGIGGGLLKFDFYINNNNNNNRIILIEFQGKQHYEASDYFGGESNLKYQQENDRLKKEYCNHNNLILIEIPYYDYNKININYLKEKIYGNYY